VVRRTFVPGLCTGAPSRRARAPSGNCFRALAVVGRAAAEAWRDIHESVVSKGLLRGVASEVLVRVERHERYTYSENEIALSGTPGARCPR
jgi:hypothetical protein